MAAQPLAFRHPEFLDDLQHWIQNDRRTARLLLDLVGAILGDPFCGNAKPEPLRYLREDVWSRRLTQDHRCVY